MMKDVWISIQSIQDVDDSEENSLEFTTDGYYYFDGENGCLSYMESEVTGPEGTQHSGESWITEADGTVTCGPTDIWEEDFSLSYGTSRWKISGKTCKPVTE